MLYFKNDLIALAYNIVETRKTEDDIKASAYLCEINRVIEHYNSTHMYDLRYVKALDKRIRDDYPIVDELSKYPSNGEPKRDISNNNEYPDDIKPLINADLFGILISVLMKENIIGKVEDALK